MREVKGAQSWAKDAFTDELSSDQVVPALIEMAEELGYEHEIINGCIIFIRPNIEVKIGKYVYYRNGFELVVSIPGPKRIHTWAKVVSRRIINYIQRC
jgi:hypothetical protein